jgi:5-formyltetrahydrofolate cyclo-ligase
VALKRAQSANQVKAWRRARRAQLVARRLAVGAATRRRWSATIVDFLRTGFPSLAARTTIGVYAPFRGEPDVRAAVDHWRRAGATTALPVVVSPGAPLEFRTFGPGVRMRKGVFGLPIPQGSPVVTPQALLIPSVGFDAAGYRLGHGGGYFDRTLAALAPPPLKIGIAFELSRIATIRPQAHDIAMDFIVTEAGIHAVTAAGLELVSDSRRIGAITRALRTRRGGRVIAPAPADVVADEVRGCASPPCYAHEFGLDD